MSLYQIIRPLIFTIDPEKAHNLSIKFLAFLPRFSSILSSNIEYENLNNRIWNINFSNPIGMSAGFDKNAEVISTLFNFGFGFVEAGTVTPKAQFGNDKPRIFRLTEDQAIINRLGFNNLGADNFEKNLKKVNRKNQKIIGINIGKNKDNEDAVKDYLLLLERFFSYADYITINISSPNTKNLRDLQNEEQLDDFLQKISILRKELVSKSTSKTNPPILLKIAPDLSLEQQKNIAKIVLKNRIDGVIISNTTVSRSFNLKSRFAMESGGLSGKPIFLQSNEILSNFYKYTEGKIPLIGVGGISSAQDAYEKILSGASLVQLYSALIFNGFGIIEKMKNDLSLLLKKNGFKNIASAIGSKH